MVGFSPRDLRTMKRMELLDLLYENEYVRTSLLGMANIGVFGDPAEKGEGAVMTLLGWGLGIGGPRAGCITWFTRWSDASAIMAAR